MTTIAAIQGDGWVVMAADSQSTINDFRAMKMSSHKVYDNNGVLIAGCGQGRGSNLLHMGFDAPHPGPEMTDLDDLDAWMVYQFVDDVRELFVEAGYDMKDDGDYAQHESAFLVAVNGVAYFMDDDYSVDRDSRGFLTAGSGGDYATGALHALGDAIFRDIEAAKAALMTAVGAAIEYDIYSGGEIRLYVQLAP